MKGSPLFYNALGELCRQHLTGCILAVCGPCRYSDHHLAAPVLNYAHLPDEVPAIDARAPTSLPTGWQT